MSSLRVVPVSDEAGLRVWQAVSAAAYAADHERLPADPVADRLPLLAGKPVDGELRRLLLAYAGDEPVAVADLSLPVHDNLETAGIDLQVHPEHRRRGYGRELATAALAEVEAAGRRRVLVELPSPWPDGPAPGERLARELGARPVLAEVRRLLDLAQPSQAPVDPPPGYRVEQWLDAAPEALVADLAALQARMSTDVPLGDLHWEPEAWDSARYRAKEADTRARGRTRVVTAVVHEPTGRAVGYTDFGVNSSAPEVAYQWDTIVDPSHRGHGLGLVLKTHNLRLLRDRVPAARWVNTWNAESNTHMVAVNDALGFRPVERWTEWQLDR